MSEPVSALNRTSSGGLARIEECGPQGMITLRGNPVARAVKSAATVAGGVRMPGVNSVNLKGEGGLCWMSPDELLILCPYDEVTATLEKMNRTLARTHSLAVDVSDARAMFRVSGPAAREVLAKLSPVDLSPDAFRPGMLRRTRLAQVSAAFWMVDGDSFQIVCFRSVADYVFTLLKTAAQPGAEVGYF